MLLFIGIISLTQDPQAVVIQPASAEDISLIIQYAKLNSLNFAVRGGGHSTSGASSVEGGIVIDLSLLRGVAVDVEQLVVSVEGGALWEDVDKATAVHSLSVVGGTVNHTGVGGLTLGGGHGWLSGKYGMVVDNLLSVSVVLASGELVEASETQNADLFWAMRGAGQNFGVAVNFTFKAHPQPKPLWAGVLIFTPDKLEHIVKFANSFESKASGEAAFAFGFSAPPPMNLPVIITACVHDGSEAEAVSIFGPLIALGPVLNTTTEMPYAEVNSIINASCAHGGRKSLNAASFEAPLDLAFVQNILADFQAFLGKVPSAGETQVLFEIIARQKIRSVPVSAMAFANRGGNYNVLIASKWYDAALDNECSVFARRLVAKIYTEAGKSAAASKYSNYSSELRNLFGKFRA